MVTVCLEQSLLPRMQAWQSPQASCRSKTTVSISPFTALTTPLLVMLLSSAAPRGVPYS